MIYAICTGVAFLACIIGKICGLGGGIIIKPVLDAVNADSVAAINFMSGCTAIGMSAWSVGRGFAKKESEVDVKISVPLASGAAAGGILGKYAFGFVASLFENPDTAGGVQACLLFAAVGLTLIYTVRKSKLKSFHFTNPVLCVFTGIVLGALGAFLGLGGGPFIMAVLFLFFSMKVKTAAQNSLFIILVSQTTGIVKLFITGDVPSVKPLLLVLMVAAGILGSETGRRINKKLSDRGTVILFEASMLLVMAVSVYNTIQFLK